MNLLGGIKCTEVNVISVFQVYNSNKDSQSEGSKYVAWILFLQLGVGLGLVKLPF